MIFSGALLALLISKNSHAGSIAEITDEAKRPTTLTVTVGELRTRIDGPKMWTMSGIEYQNTVMAVEESAYGTVVTFPGEKHLGTAHFLDVPGKPGEIEKEDVTGLKFFLDDKIVTGMTPKMDLAGKSFRMERKSRIRNLDLDSIVDLRDGVLMETAHIRTREPVELEKSYPLMYAWTPKATAYVFGDDSGIQKRGTFRSVPDKAEEGREKSSRWMAVFDPGSGKGAVCYLVQHPTTAEAWLQYTDAPGVYRKLRIMSFVGQTVPAGFEGTFRTILGFFRAKESDWEGQAQKRVTELKARIVKLDQK
ncbi:MAG: hypothetical protein NTZ01_03320 [Verrucomicrobia bacterium]|nr:hypothetical protein [Verrucomicrobiota bacterium]